MIDQFAKQLFNDLNEKVSGFSQNHEAGSQIKAIVESALRKLDLVTREEFDAQQAVLMRTREKLDSLEKEVEALHEQLKNAK